MHLLQQLLNGFIIHLYCSYLIPTWRKMKTNHKMFIKGFSFKLIYYTGVICGFTATSLADCSAPTIDYVYASVTRSLSIPNYEGHSQPNQSQDIVGACAAQLSANFLAEVLQCDIYCAASGCDFSVSVSNYQPCRQLSPEHSDFGEIVAEGGGFIQCSCDLLFKY